MENKMLADATIREIIIELSNRRELSYYVFVIEDDDGTPRLISDLEPSIQRQAYEEAMSLGVSFDDSRRHPVIWPQESSPPERSNRHLSEATLDEINTELDHRLASERFWYMLAWFENRPGDLPILYTKGVLPTSFNERLREHKVRNWQRIEEKFVVGEWYYSYGVAQVGQSTRRLVETYVYRGIERRECNSRACEVPYHYHIFQVYLGRDMHGNEYGPGSDHIPSIGIPSLEQADSSMLTWDEFLLSLQKEDLDGPSE